MTVVIVTFLSFSYALYFGLDRETAVSLALEDNLFESLTVLFFLIASYFFARNYFITRNLYFLLLVITFLVAAGEEMSWGQRYFAFNTPTIMGNRNRQNEFNIHNLDIFHPQNEAGISKSGIEKLITIDFLYNLFWLSWCIVVPILHGTSGLFSRFFTKVKLPIPLLRVGKFFLLNFCVFLVLRNLISAGKSDLYYMKLREVYECCSALIFAIVARAFYVTYKSSL